jgi:hypothetical protein
MRQPFGRERRQNWFRVAGWVHRSAPNRATLLTIPSMLGLEELLGILVVIAAIWFVVKMARVALRLISFLAGLILILGLLYIVFVR